MITSSFISRSYHGAMRGAQGRVSLSAGGRAIPAPRAGFAPMMRSRRFREPFHAQVSKPPARRRICQVDRTNCPFKLQVTRRGRLVLHAGGWARAGKETHQILIAPRCADPTWYRCRDEKPAAHVDGLRQARQGMSTPPSPPPSLSPQRILATVWLAVFSSSLFFRAVDPIIPQIA